MGHEKGREQRPAGGQASDPGASVPAAQSPADPDEGVRGIGARAPDPVGGEPTRWARPASEESAEDVVANLDEGEAPESYESLVAQLAGLPDDDEPGSAAPLPAGRRVARVEDDAGEMQVLDLDLDAPAPLSRPGRAGPKPGGGPAPTVQDEAARLAIAAARGGVAEDLVPSFSLGEDDASTPEARARLLAQALAHAEHQEARYRLPSDPTAKARWKGVAASLLFLMAGWAAAFPPDWARPTPPAQLDAAGHARSVHAALALQAQQVEAFRLETQRLPNTLDEVTSTLPGIRYARSGNRAYQLVGYDVGGAAIIYDSADPAPPFRSLMEALLPRNEAP